MGMILLQEVRVFSIIIGPFARAGPFISPDDLAHYAMGNLAVPLVSESDRRTGHGNRWQTHLARRGPDGPLAPPLYVGMTPGQP